MNTVQTPRPIMQLPGTVPFSARKTFAANAGASVLANISVPINTLAIVTARVRASAGILARLAATAVNASETFTLAAGHGLVTGMTAYVGGTTLPSGVSGTTLYYLNVSSNTVKLYDTAANAVTGSGTGLVSFTTDGAGVYLDAVPLVAAYTVQVAAANKDGTTALVGSADKVSFEDVSGWDVTATANNSTSVLEIKGTPDGNVATTFEVLGEVQTLSLLA